MLSPLVHIVVLNWNGSEDTIKCINSLKQLDYSNFEIVVVDNGSVDDSVAVLSQIHKITLITNSDNLGFTGGNNVAIRRAMELGAEYVWLVNSDVTVSSDCLSKMIAVAEKDPQIGLISPIIYFAEKPQRPQYCVGVLDYPYYDIRESFDLSAARRLQADHPERIMLWGTALLIRRETIKTIGFLDDYFFAYFEDFDYCVRSLKANFKNIAVFDASVWHENPVEFGKRKPHYYYYHTRNDIFFIKKQIHSVLTRLKVLRWRFLRCRPLLANLKHDPLLVNALLAGLWDGWRGVTGRYDANRRMPLVVRWLALL